MKDIISKNKSTSSCSRFCVNDRVNITNDKNEITENFNSFFINVGPNLAIFHFPIADKLYDQEL